MQRMDQSYITSEANHFLYVMGLGHQRVTSNGLRIILLYAILGYLNSNKPINFPLEVALALRKQSILPLTPDMEKITKKLQELKAQEKPLEEIKIALSDVMRRLEEEHNRQKNTFVF